MKCAFLALILLSACGQNLSDQEKKAQDVSCNLMRDLYARGLITTLPFTDQEQVRAKLYSETLWAIQGGPGVAISATPKQPCVLQ